MGAQACCLAMLLLLMLGACRGGHGGYGAGIAGIGGPGGGGYGFAPRSPPREADDVSRFQGILSPEQRLSRCGAGGRASEASWALCFAEAYLRPRVETEEDARERERRCRKFGGRGRGC